MDNKLTETGSSNRRVAAVPIWVKPYLTIEEAAEEIMHALEKRK